ncbi:hypothetical protein Tcan_18108 [Toxocara canis]|uniref:MADF domain-containing protein n=1 Tax=Toxocara canis TaxID=6265 RepID=A0A0B2UXN6_TOXCA|nr:hypothetical protein Tcan_18108 [Toxocara canis]
MAGSASTTVGASASSPQDENFVRRLIEAVKGQPCLYNPNHEHYGNKHSSAQYRCRVWQKLCQDLGFTEDAHALQMQWKRIRDRYVRERRKRRSANTNENLSHQVPSNNNGQANHSMVGSPANGPVSTPQPTPHIANAQQLQGQNGGVMSIVVTTSAGGEPVTYYMNEGAVARHDATQPVVVSTSADGIILNSYDQRTPQGSQQQATQLVATPQTQHDYATQSRSTNIPNGASGSSKSAPGPSSATGSPCSSTTSSEIDVGSVATFANQQQTQQISHQPSMVVLTPVSQQQRPAPPQQLLYTKTDPQPRIGEPIQTADGSVVTVTARGTAPMATILKKDLNIRTNDGGTVTMIIDPTTFYQHGSQKMYRLVNVSELNAADMVPLTGGAVGASTSDVKLITTAPARRKRVATMSVGGMPNGRGQLGDDLILDDGISEKTVTIDQTSQSPMSNERILIDHQPLMTVGPSNVMLAQPNIHQVHHQQHPSTSQQHSGLTAGGHHATISQHVPPNTGQLGALTVRQQTQAAQQTSAGQRFIAQPLTVQQPQYTLLSSQPIQTQHDADLAFANSIATHLSRLNEDEKAVAKMNIQRILMDARFGMGACARMIHDEELNEAAASSANHEVVGVQQQQQHVDASARR